MSRFSVIVVSLLALSVPAAGICGAVGERMEACAMTAPHDMADCADELGFSPSCCDPSAARNTTELVLNRPDEDTVLPAAAGSGLASGAAEPGAFRLMPLDTVPPPGRASYRLFSALLL